MQNIAKKVKYVGRTKSSNATFCTYFKQLKMEEYTG